MNRMNALKGVAIALAAVSTVLVAAASPAETAQAEYDQVMALEPDADNGRRVYLTCAVCHRPEGWGSIDGSYPQIAGQLRTVIIKDVDSGHPGNEVVFASKTGRAVKAELDYEKVDANGTYNASAWIQSTVWREEVEGGIARIAAGAKMAESPEDMTAARREAIKTAARAGGKTCRVRKRMTCSLSSDMAAAISGLKIPLFMKVMPMKAR